MNTRSRSNTSTSPSVTSPCTWNTSPHSSIASSAGIDLLDGSDAGIRMRRRAGGIEFRADDEAAALCRADLLRRRGVREIQRHQRLEARAGWQRRENAVAIRGSHGDRRHRRLEIRHDDRARELPRRERQDAGELGAVAHVQVPVVRSKDSQGRMRRQCACASTSSPLPSNSTVYRTPKPVISVGTWPRPPLRLLAARSMWIQGTCAGTKRFRKRAARM